MNGMEKPDQNLQNLRGIKILNGKQKFEIYQVFLTLSSRTEKPKSPLI